MNSYVISLGMLAAMASLVASQEVQNPYRKANVGDYIVYQTLSQSVLLDAREEISRKEEVSAKDDKRLKIKITAVHLGRELPSRETIIDLENPLDLAARFLEGYAIRGKFKKTADGKESVMVGGKKFECAWLSGRIIDKDRKIDWELKIWTSRHVPLSGVVKAEINYVEEDTGADISWAVELSKFGCKK